MAITPPSDNDPSLRLQRLVRQWNVVVSRTVDTQTSILAFGVRQNDPVVLKIVKAPTEEWHTGAAAAAFQGCGMVRVYEAEPGAVLMEELYPGTALVELVDAGRDDESTIALATVIGQMIDILPPTLGYPTVEHWGLAFDRYLSSADKQIPESLVEHARARYRELCATQSNVRLLHGDLQHYNVLSDRRRGWIAIDPKGVVGELEYELGAACRNPHGHPELYSSASVVMRRIERFARTLPIDVARTAAWSFSQAVLSAIWSVEDEAVITGDVAALRLAVAMQPIVQ